MIGLLNLCFHVAVVVVVVDDNVDDIRHDVAVAAVMMVMTV